MTPTQFERILDRAAAILTDNLRSGSIYSTPENFEQHALNMLKVAANESVANVEPTFHARAFPDIKVNGFGVEVKFTNRDTWQAVGNSVFEGMRDNDVDLVYVIFGKAGGVPEARWKRYSECVDHVRVSNSPRFVINMQSESSLFDEFGLPYQDFAALSREEKMRYVRDYSRVQMKEGDRLWWIDDESHSLPLNVRLYINLSSEEKLRLRAEAAILCPQICSGRRARGKYNAAAMYILTHHGVLCTQMRDLFTAGSVAMRRNDARGGHYTQRALHDIQDLMRDAAARLDDALFVEYWGASCPPERRIAEWLRRADEYAGDYWTPSDSLFLPRGE